MLSICFFFSVVLTCAGGEDRLNELRAYIAANKEMVCKYIEDHIPELRASSAIQGYVSALD